MRKFNLELPKFRLELHMKLIKRRKPLMAEALIPSVAEVSKKYRSGSFLGKFVRHFSERKNLRKIFAANFAFFAIASTFIPSVKASTNEIPDEPVIQVQNPINTQKGIQFPLDSYGLSQGFGFFHPGIDMTAPIGTPVKSIRSGIITFAGYSSDGYGNNIIINHGKGLESLYAHLSKIEVRQGEIVNMNTVIGRVGITGHTSGPHLHLEVHQDGYPINPLTVLSR